MCFPIRGGEQAGSTIRGAQDLCFGSCWLCMMFLSSNILVLLDSDSWLFPVNERDCAAVMLRGTKKAKRGATGEPAGGRRGERRGESRRGSKHGGIAAALSCLTSDNQSVKKEPGPCLCRNQASSSCLSVKNWKATFCIQWPTSAHCGNSCHQRSR